MGGNPTESRMVFYRLKRSGYRPVIIHVPNFCENSEPFFIQREISMCHVGTLLHNVSVVLLHLIRKPIHMEDIINT